MVITRVLEALWRVERTSIETHLDLCCRNRHRLSTCTRCVDACPAGALELDDGLQIDLDRCRQCGICATVCPTGALEARSPSNERLLEAVRTFLVKHRGVVFSCPRNAECLEDRADETIHVPCLGRLDESVLVGTAVAGAEAIYLLDTMCETCQFLKGHNIAQKTSSRASQLLEAIGIPRPITSVSTMPEARPAVAAPDAATPCMSRRAFFREFLRETSRMGAVLTTPETQDEPVAAGVRQPSTNLPAKRRLLLDALWKNAETALNGVMTPPGLWNAVEIGEDCSVCQMCAYFCPTGALRQYEQDGEKGISSQAANCVACNLCVDTCYKKTVHVSDQVYMERILDNSVVMLASREATAGEPQPGSNTKLEAAIRAALGL